MRGRSHHHTGGASAVPGIVAALPIAVLTMMMVTVVSGMKLKVMAAIERCRTAALGGHVARCEDCTHTVIAYNSCLMGKFRNGE